MGEFSRISCFLLKFGNGTQDLMYDKAHALPRGTLTLGLEQNFRILSNVFFIGGHYFHPTAFHQSD
jgi:hypothetical protein